MNVKCMVCQKSKRVTLPKDLPPSGVAWAVAVKYEWACSMKKGLVFLCCPDCYPKAFDTSVGSVGKLRPEFEKFAERYS